MPGRSSDRSSPTASSVVDELLERRHDRLRRSCSSDLAGLAPVQPACHLRRGAGPGRGRAGATPTIAELRRRTRRPARGHACTPTSCGSGSWSRGRSRPGAAEDAEDIVEAVRSPRARRVGCAPAAGADRVVDARGPGRGRARVPSSRTLSRTWPRPARADPAAADRSGRAVRLRRGQAAWV